MQSKYMQYSQVGQIGFMCEANPFCTVNICCSKQIKDVNCSFWRKYRELIKESRYIQKRKNTPINNPSIYCSTKRRTIRRLQKSSKSNRIKTIRLTPKNFMRIEHNKKSIEFKAIFDAQKVI